MRSVVKKIGEMVDDGKKALQKSLDVPRIERGTSSRLANAKDASYH